MPPLAIAAGMAVAAGVSAYAASQAAKKAAYKGPEGPAPSNANGGEVLGTDADTREQMGRIAQQREGVQLDNALGDESRGSQMDALGMMRERALGNTPSVAQLQMRQGLDQAMRNQAALAGSARGQAALAMAQQNAGVNNAMLSQGIAGQTGILRAQEMSDALNQYGGMGTSIRGLDEGRASTQGSLDANQRGLNDQYQLGMYGQAAGLNQAEVQARIAANQQALQAWEATANQKRDAAAQQSAASQQQFTNTLGAASGAYNAGMTAMPPSGAAKPPPK